MICYGLLIMFCTNSAPIQVSDSYCQTYQRVVIEKGDGKISAPLNVRKRIAANEVTYRCLCTGWQDPICKVR